MTSIELLSEDTLRAVVDSLVRLVEAAGATVIFAGAVVAVVKFLVALARRSVEAFVPVRLSLGRRTALNFFLAREIAEERRQVIESAPERDRQGNGGLLAPSAAGSKEPEPTFLKETDASSASNRRDPGR